MYKATSFKKKKTPTIFLKDAHRYLNKCNGCPHTLKVYVPKSMNHILDRELHSLNEQPQ